MNHHDLADFVGQVRARPGMYGLTGTYHPAMTFLVGYDLGRSGELLRGFSEWLVARRGVETSLGWPALVIEETFPGAGVSHWERLDQEQQRQAVSRLFDLLIEFHREADGPR